MASIIKSQGIGPQGWTPGFHDKNDRYYVPKPNVDISQHPGANLRKTAGSPLASMPIYNQGHVNSCVANANALAFWYELKLANDATIGNHGPSRWFLYWNALKGDQVDEYTKSGPLQNIGTWNRHAAKILNVLGVCSEDSCPYASDQWPLFVDPFLQVLLQRSPDPACYIEAGRHKIAGYYRLDADRSIDEKVEPRTVEEMDAVGEITLDNVKRCLVDGHPVVFAFRFYWPSIPWDKSQNSWRFPDIWSGPNKVVDARHQSPKVDHGGHAVVAIGYDDSRSAIIVQNSWGNSSLSIKEVDISNVLWSDWKPVPEVGEDSVFWMPYDWVKDFAATNDFWTLRLQEEKSMTTEEMDHKVREVMARRKQ